MTRKKPILAAALFGLVGLWGASVLVMAQADSLATALQQYETQTKKKVDRNKAGDMAAWAKWCYQNEKSAEAKTIAIEGLQKAPDDLRLKYLVYALADVGAVAVTEDTTPKLTAKKSPSISKEDAEKTYKQEGELVMRKFKEIQDRVLIPRCGQKCHGGQDEKAKDKWWMVLKDNDDRRMLADNFQTLQPYFDRDKRMDSKILVVPAKSPENVHTQVFKGPEDPGYKLLVRWILTLEGIKIFK